MSACGYKACKRKPIHGSRRCARHKGKHWKSVRKLAVRGGRRTRVVKRKTRKSSRRVKA